MNPTSSLSPPERTHPPKLDALIGEAERAVVERDLQLRRDARRLSDRLHSGAVRRAGIAVAVAAGGLVAGAWLWGRRRRPVGSVYASREHAAASHGSSPALWAHLLPLAWPMLPIGVRSRMSPRTATVVLGLMLPLVARAQRAKPTTTVQSALRVDLPRYAGHWFEIARLPLGAERHCASDVMATYSLDGDGLHIRNRCRRADGSSTAVEGAAYPIEGGNGAKLRMSFAPMWLRFLPWAWHDYWILRVDDDYQSALVGTPDRKHLWLLSRTPRLGVAPMQAHLDHARIQGYDTSRLRHTPQR